ncbi:MAG: NUDIX hydrolase [Synechococcus sp.]
MGSPSPSWQTLDRFLEVTSPWMTLIGERLQDDGNRLLDYWRVETANSAVILTVQGNHLILPPAMYRPGVGQLTLDFPGGRVLQEERPEAAIPDILERELGVPAEAIASCTSLNEAGWQVNSSFSNQKLFGFVVYLKPTVQLAADRVGERYAVTDSGIQSLLEKLTCLQCRTVLLTWLYGQNLSRKLS